MCNMIHGSQNCQNKNEEVRIYYFSEEVHFTNIYQKKCNLFHELISSPDRKLPLYYVAVSSQSFYALVFLITACFQQNHTGILICCQYWD